MKTSVFMLKNQTDHAQSMTIQSIECLTQKSTETMQSSDRQNAQQLTTNKNGHISFSVASLLADTRPTRPATMSPGAASSPPPAATIPSSVSIPTTSPTTNHSSDDEYDSNQEDSIVDVEDLNSEHQKSGSPSKEQQDFLTQQHRDFARDGAILSTQGPIRPTPFSALAAAVYQAAHPNWASQGLVGPFPGPGHMFQGPAGFGVPSLNSG